MKSGDHHERLFIGVVAHPQVDNRRLRPSDLDSRLYPQIAHDQVDALARSLRRSRNSLLTEAVERYLEMQKRQIAHIEDGLADLEAGRVHTHKDMKDLVREFERMAHQDASH
jgi:predicted transcriptional regulator